MEAPKITPWELAEAAERIDRSENLREEKEFILWGLPKGETDPLHQQILYTQGKSMSDVERVKGLASKEGWHSFKVQIIDLSQPFDAGKAFRKAIDRKAVDRLVRGAAKGRGK